MLKPNVIENRDPKIEEQLDKFDISQVLETSSSIHIILSDDIPDEVRVKMIRQLMDKDKEDYIKREAELYGVVPEEV